ncbi:YggT family protein [Helicobacter anatolicus]|uniref:YggT family protein n=1 Tax=Helicobacter anatolicus TaxID=2905874 RepID=UPI001E5AAB00|nr:YggT family protein [Helicobacter anatolicus]MCE3039279.1 YggT family protein [Helicobacter anatolicus]
MGILLFLISIYGWVVVISSLFEWLKLDSKNIFVRFVYQITHPVLNFLRSRFPLQYQGIDFSSLVLIIILFLIREFIQFLMTLS